MRRLPRTPLLGALAALAATTLTARADTTITLSLVSQPERPPEERELVYVDGPLPASESFQIELRVGRAIRPTANVEIWPSEFVGACAYREKPKPNGRQYHRIGLVAKGSGDDTVLRGTVPPLQVDASYCFRVHYREGASPAQVKMLAQLAAATITQNNVIAPSWAAAAPPPPTTAAAPTTAPVDLCGLSPTAEQLLPPFQTAFSDALKRTGLAAAALHTQAAGRQPASEAMVAPAISAFIETRACELYVKESQAAATAVDEATDAEKALAAALAALPDKPLHDPAPQLMLGGNLISAQTLLVATATNVQLQDAIDALSRTYVATPAVQRWRQLFTNLLALSGKPRDAAIAKAKRDVLTAPYRLDWAYWTGTELISAPALRSQALRHDLAAIKAQVWRAVPTTERSEWMNAVDVLERAKRKRDAAVADKVEKLKAFDAAYDKLYAALTASLAQTAVDLDHEPAVANLRKGLTGHTVDVSNYGSVDVGMLVSLPIVNGFQRGSVWVAPYVGINVYTVPVDRKINIDELVGRRLRQRISVTIGLTADAESPTVGTRKTSGLVLNRVPLLAVGVRFTPQLRMSAGFAFFRVANANPLSSATELGVAPFVGGSVDFDIIALAKGKLL